MEIIKSLGLRECDRTVRDLLQRQELVSSHLKSLVERKKVLVERNKQRFPQIEKLEKTLLGMEARKAESSPQSSKRKRSINKYETSEGIYVWKHPEEAPG
jgi:hypothetical protein